MNITFENFDKLGRKEIADRLTKAISTFYQFKKDAYVLSLNATYGSGKTTFLKMWKADLEDPKRGDQKYKVIYIDAWESDFSDEPLVPIISALLNELGNNASIKTFLQSALGAVALVGNTLLSTTTGINVKEIEEEYEDELTDSDIVKKGKAIYNHFSYKVDAYKNLKDSLEAYVASLEQKPLIVLVDELDRVRPDYAVKFLEAIKHVFSVQGVCFVLAVDREQLKLSVEQLYGKIDFDGYYRRFITRETTLPQIKSVKNLEGFVGQVAEEYLDTKTNAGLSFVFTPSQQSKIIKHAARVARVFRLSPREVELLFRVYSQLMAVDAPNTYVDEWITSPLNLIALQIKNSSLYHLVGTRENSPKDLLDYLDSLNYEIEDWDTNSTSDDLKRPFVAQTIAFTCARDNEVYLSEMETEFKERYKNLFDLDNINPLKYIAAYTGDSCIRDLPYSDPLFQQIYKKIEEWRDFIG